MTKNTEHKEFTLVYDACTHVSLVADLETINKKIDFMLQLSAEDFLPQNHKLKLYQIALEELPLDDKIHDRITASGVYTSVSELMKDMEFYEVIRQRLNHIWKINFSVLSELKERGFDPSSLDNTKYIKIMTMLARISSVQLQVINYEYRSVIYHLKKCLNNINEFVNVEFNSLDVYHFSNIALFDVVSETICNKLRNISEMIYSENKYNRSLSEEEEKSLQLIFTTEKEQKILKKVLELSASNKGTASITATILQELKEADEDRRQEMF